MAVIVSVHQSFLWLYCFFWESRGGFVFSFFLIALFVYFFCEAD